MTNQRARARVNLIKGLHQKLGLYNEIEDVDVSEPVSKKFDDKHIRRGLERIVNELKTDLHQIKVSILKAFLSQVERYGFLEEGYDYVDWCSGRGELAYAIKHLFGGDVVRVDKKFRKRNIFDQYFTCTDDYEIPKITFDLTTLRENKDLLQIPKEPKNRVVYVGTHCCGSLPDLVVRYAELQARKPDFIALVPCHHEKMDFELSTLAAIFSVRKDIFGLLTKAVAVIQSQQEYTDVARKAMEIIDYFRAENLKLLGYDAKVLRFHSPNVPPYNHLILGVRS